MNKVSTIETPINKVAKPYISGDEDGEQEDGEEDNEGDIAKEGEDDVTP